ncbi:MAG: hypothetical protein J6R29_04195 [Clostridia bacterium]|nr:hypothetical protein [Clostridia bacterium]
MINFYDENYINKIIRQKNKCLAIYLVVAIILFLIIVATIVLNSIFPYNFGHRPILLAILCVVTVVLVVFSFVYLQIVYGKVAGYLNFLGLLTQNLKRTATVTVIRVNAQIVSGQIDYYSVDVLEWSDIDEDYVERSVFIDAEFANLDFKKDEIITIITASNHLLAYKKGA